MSKTDLLFLIYNNKERRYIIGGIGSGFNPKVKKKGTYKIFGLRENNSDEYFFYGVSKNFLCKIKSYIIWDAKKNYNLNNKLYNLLRELDFNFTLEQLESLPVDFTRKQSKLYLQEHYIDGSYNLCNKKNFCYCQAEIAANRKHQLTKEIKEIILNKYNIGITYRQISIELNISYDSIRYTVNKAGGGKKIIIKKIVQRLNNGEDIHEINKEYNLKSSQLNYILSKKTNNTNA